VVITLVVVMFVENIDQKDFEKMLHDIDEMKNPIEREKVVVDKREKEIKMNWNLFVDLN
jgi:hypothetical protein